MAFLPDEAVMRSGEVAPGAFRLYAYYCMRRDASTGTCYPSLRRAQADLNFKSYSYTSEMRTVLLQKQWIEMTLEGEIKPLLGFQTPTERAEEVSEKTEKVSEISEEGFGKNRTEFRKKPKPVSEISETHIKEEPAPLTSPLEPKDPRAPHGQFVEVFTHWRSVMGHEGARATPEREKAVRARLRDGYTVEDIKQAIDGCRASPFHMGQNDAKKRYDDLTLICRNGAKLEDFKAMGTRPKAEADRRAKAEADYELLRRMTTEADDARRRRQEGRNAAAAGHPGAYYGPPAGAGRREN